MRDIITRLRRAADHQPAVGSRLPVFGWWKLALVCILGDFVIVGISFGRLPLLRRRYDIVRLGSVASASRAGLTGKTGRTYRHGYPAANSLSRIFVALGKG